MFNSAFFDPFSIRCIIARDYSAIVIIRSFGNFGKAGNFVKKYRIEKTITNLKCCTVPSKAFVTLMTKVTHIFLKHLYISTRMDPGDIDHCAFLFLNKVRFFIRQSKNFIKAKILLRYHLHDKILISDTFDAV